jgi:drug/metabolite transporter (DMT)-like permease
MADGLSLTQFVMLTLYAVAMAAGQILFKMAALKGPAADSFGNRLLGLTQNGFFAAAIVLYAALAITWVWILSFTPLSRAYLFVAIAFAITPVAAGIFFGEPISPRVVVGIGLVFAGLLCVAG